MEYFTLPFVSDHSMFLRLLLVIFLVFSTVYLPSQSVLVDSITQLLTTTKAPAERMDLLLGLVRAKSLGDGAASSQTIVTEALAYAQEINDSIGYGFALGYQADANFNDLNHLLTSAPLVRDIGIRHRNPDLEFFGRYHLIEYYLYDKNDFSTTWELIQQGLPRRHGVGHKNLGNFLKTVAIYHQYKGQKDSARHYHQLALAEFRAVGDDPDILPDLGRPSSQDWDHGELNAAQILNYLSRFHVQEQAYDKADENLQRSLSIAKRWGSYDMEAWTNEELGSLRRSEGRFTESIKAYERALSIYTQYGSTKYLSAVNRDIGNLFLLAKNPEVALTYFQRGYQSALDIRDSIEVSAQLLLIGRTANQMGQNELAQDKLNEAVTLSLSMNDTLSVGYSLASLASTEVALGNYELGLKLYHQARRIHERYRNPAYLLQEHSGLANLHLLTGQLDSASYYGQLAQEFANKNGSLSARSSVAGLQARIAEAADDYPAALRFERLNQRLKDSLLTQESNASLRSAQVRQNVADYQAEKEAAERETALLEQRNRLYLYLALTLLFLLGIGGFLFAQLRSARHKLTRQNQQLTNLNATKDRFFGIIAHDLRNPIVALQSADSQIEYYAERNDNSNVKMVAELVGDTARNLSRLLDNLLNWALSQQGVLPYRPELLPLAEIVEEVVELYRGAASSKGITLDFYVKAGLSVYADPPSLHAIIRNLLGNAIKFTPAGGKITILGKEEENKMTLEISDDGIGMAPDRLQQLFHPAAGSSRGTRGESGSGLGLVLVRDLTELNGGTISATSVPGMGSTFHLELPSKEP